jgi:hypothetical protein
MKPESQTFVFLIEEDKKHVTVKTIDLAAAIRYMDAYANGRKYVQIPNEPKEE